MGLYREAKEIDQQIWNLGYRELPKPVQRGWTMRLTLREDFKKRKDHKYWEELLTIVQTSKYCNNKEFMHKPDKNKKKEKIKIGTRSLSGVNYELLEEKYKKPFEKRLVSTFLWGSYFNPTFKFCLVQDYMFVPAIFPHMVTKVKIMDSVLESKSKRLWNKIDSHNYYPIIDKELGQGYKDDWNYESKERMYRQEKIRFLDFVREEKYDDI